MRIEKGSPLWFPLTGGAVVAAVAALAIGDYFNIGRTPTPPTLVERYAESWGWTGGASIRLVPELRLTASVGQERLFTPAVCAPPETALSNVVLVVNLPAEIAPTSWIEPSGWAVQTLRKNVMRFVAIYGLPVTRGTCGNPEASLFLKPTGRGHWPISYRIMSAEASPVTGSFIVEVQ